MDSKYGALNTVSAVNQLAEGEYSKVFEDGGDLKILFVGNSITKHGYLAEIGWFGNWGMAASCEEKDFVHLVVGELSKKTSVDYSIAQLANWERAYWDTDNILPKEYQTAIDFAADIVVVRIGENMPEIEDEKVCKENFEKMIKYFCKNPNAKVVLTNLFWNKAVLNKIIKEVADENNYIFCDISDLEKDEKTMAIGLFEHKGIAVHPGDYGMKCIADRILDSIATIKE